MLKSKQHTLFDIILLTALIASFFMLFMGSYGLIDPDEGRYNEVAREMLASHQYIVPYLNGVLFLDKPILFYWLQAGAMHLFGINPFAMRLVPMMFGVIACLSVYATGRALFDRTTGIVSALILATTTLWYASAHFSNMDLEVSTWLCASLFCFSIAIDSAPSKKRSVLLMLAYVFSAAAFLTKGLIGIAFPMMIIGLWMLCCNRWDALRKMHLLAGLALFLVCILPWLWKMGQHVPAFWQYFFVDQQVGRYFNADMNDQQPIWYYGAVIVAGAIPWSAFYLQACWSQIKSTPFLVIWVLSVLVFFSIPASKPLGYILPVFPPLSLLVGRYIAQHWHAVSGLRTGVWLSIAALLVLMLGLCVVSGFSFSPQFVAHRFYCWICAGILLLGVVGTLCGYLKWQSTRFVFIALLATSALFQLGLIVAVPAVGVNDLTALVHTVKPAMTKSDTVVSYDAYEQSLPLYLGHRIVIVFPWKGVRANSDGWPSYFAFGREHTPDAKTWLINQAQFWQQWDAGRPMVIWTEREALPEFRRHVRAFRLLGTYKDTVVLR